MSTEFKQLRIVFWGTPDFAVPSLKAITQSEHKVVAVVTAPDKPRGRGQKVSFSPVKEFAASENIPVFQPGKLKGNDELIRSLKELNYDLNVVVAFRILPPELFNLPPYGSFNLHGSLLPELRGAAPIQWSLIRGYTETGLTTFKIEEKVDTGNIYLQYRMPVLPFDDFGTLHDKMSFAGTKLITDTLDLIASGNYTLQSQDITKATTAPKITKEICEIKWDSPAIELYNLIRGLSPAPGAFFVHNGKVIKIYKAETAEGYSLSPGEIFTGKKEVVIGCNPGCLRILEIQKEGHKRMRTDEFLRGSSL